MYRHEASGIRHQVDPTLASSLPRAFTLTELMIAVVVLLVVILATAKIFSTTSKVTSVGQATADVLQEVGAIERQLRADLAQLSPDGFFAIRCVAVRNDVHGTPLLNPTLPPEAVLRADQLMFFRTGAASTQRFVGSNNLPAQGGNSQAAVSRVYYGHAFQVPEADTTLPTFDVHAGFAMVPWFRGNADFVNPNTGALVAGDEPANQPEAQRWLLARQAVLLADDGGSTDFFLSPSLNSTATIWDARIRNSRVDIAASQLNDIRDNIQFDSTGAPRTWDEQRDLIGDALFYPRVERIAPKMFQSDQMLSAAALAGACSSFAVDWTYDHRVGEAVNAEGTVFNGIYVDPTSEQPWFGLAPDFTGDGNADDGRGVAAYGNAGFQSDAGFVPAATIDPAVLERFPSSFNMLGQSFGIPSGVLVYEACFGYNADQPLGPATVSPLAPSYMPSDAAPQSHLNYTPWPSALRITMTLHDNEAKLAAGREVQFIIKLPERGR
jgi:prepilin-type N-terminal cleavage/methylation domain-containing protein